MTEAWTIFEELAVALAADHTGLGLTLGGADLSVPGQVRLGLERGPHAAHGDQLQMVLVGFDDQGEQGQTLEDWMEQWRVTLVGYAEAGPSAPERWRAAGRLAQTVKTVLRRYFLQGPGTAFELATQWVVTSVELGDLQAEAPSHGHYGVCAIELRFDIEVG